MQQMEEQSETPPFIQVDGENARVASRDLFERVDRIERVRTRRLDIRRVRKIVINNPPVPPPLRVAPKAFDNNDPNAIVCPKSSCRQRTLTHYYTTCFYCGTTYTVEQLKKLEEDRMAAFVFSACLLVTVWAVVQFALHVTQGATQWQEVALLSAVAVGWVAYFYRERWFF